jgi:hypothetical protein
MISLDPLDGDGKQQRTSSTKSVADLMELSA